MNKRFYFLDCPLFLKKWLLMCYCQKEKYSTNTNYEKLQVN